MTFGRVQLDRFYKWSSCLAQLHSLDVGEPTCLSFSTTGMCARTTYLHFGQREPPFHLQESLCSREEELSAPRISLFSKRGVSLTFLVSLFVFV